jgi:hypothetical protein
MEGIGAEWVVLVHRQELRDALISEQSLERQRVSRAHFGLWARGGALLRLVAASVQWRLASHASARTTSVATQIRRESMSHR